MNYNYLKRINVIRILFGICSIALALGWGKFINAGYVYFPFFPDVFDVLLGITIGLFLIYEALSPSQKLPVNSYEENRRNYQRDN